MATINPNYSFRAATKAKAETINPRFKSTAARPLAVTNFVGANSSGGDRPRKSEFYVCMPLPDAVGISACRYCGGEMRQDRHGGWNGWDEQTGERNACLSLLQP